MRGRRAVVGGTPIGYLWDDNELDGRRAVIYDATTNPPLIVARSAGDVLVPASSLGVVFLRLADRCSRGVTPSIEPASAATIAREARADDGLTVAVALDVVSPVDIQVTGTRDGKVVASVEIHIPPTAG